MKCRMAVVIAIMAPLIVQADPIIDITQSDQSIDKEMDAWSHTVFDKFHGNLVISCQTFAAPLEKTLVCLNVGTPEEMFSILGPASIFSEGNYGFKKGTLVDRSKVADLIKTQEEQLFDYNLKGVDLRRFLKETEKQCVTNSDKCLSKDERLFFDKISNQIDKKDFVLITSTFFPMFFGDAHLTAISHELMHVMYMQNANYLKIANDFWHKDVSASDKQLAKDSFKEIYDIDVEYVVINEFQAHILQRRPEEGKLPELSLKYRSSLMQKLGGLAPAEFQFESEN